MAASTSAKAESLRNQLPNHQRPLRRFRIVAHLRLPATRALQLQAVALPVRHAQRHLFPATGHRHVRMRPAAAPSSRHAALGRGLLALQHADAFIVPAASRSRQSTLQTLCATWRPSLAGRWPAPGGMRSPLPGRLCAALWFWPVDRRPVIPPSPPRSLCASQVRGRKRKVFVHPLFPPGFPP